MDLDESRLASCLFRGDPASCWLGVLEWLVTRISWLHLERESPTLTPIRSRQSQG